MGNSASRSASSRGDITSKKKTNIKRKQFQQIESSGDVEAQERSSISATTTAEQHPTTADAHEDESPHNTHDSTEVSGRIRPDGQDKHLSRSLSQRHIQMMALAGAIV
jgi:amino acid permease